MIIMMTMMIMRIFYNYNSYKQIAPHANKLTENRPRTATEVHNDIFVDFVDLLTCLFLLIFVDFVDFVFILLTC